MKLIRSLFLFAMLFSPMWANELRVPLATDDPLIPLYLAKSPSEIDAILSFDLNHNGRTKTVSRQADRDELLLGREFQHNYWKASGLAYIIQPEIEANTLTVRVYNCKTSRTQVIRRKGHTRRHVHEIADAIHEMIFGERGIASTRILYALQLPKENHSWSSEIWSCDYDGENRMQVTEEHDYCINPRFIPGRPQDFLYVNYKQGQPKIYTASFQDGHGNELIALRGNQLLPTFAQFGDKLAFISDASGRADLFIQPMNGQGECNGKPIQAYSFPRSVQASPTFSPDGKQIAFVSDKEGTPRIYLIETPLQIHNQKRPKAKCLTRTYRENTCPAWSPDGTKLAYSAKVDGTRQIFIYDFESQEEIQLTSGKSHKENPCWARNSFHIIYNSSDPSSSELYLMNLNQKVPVKISGDQGRKHYPAWGWE